MDKNTIDDAGKELADLKDFLNIKDEPKKVDRLSDEDVYAAIEKLKENWFTAENLSELLERMKNCSIYANAGVMLSILKLFTEREPNLKFNNVSECIFQIVSSIDGYHDDINSKFKQLIDLLQFIIQNTDENDNLILENVLTKISY
ncbi:MAG: hypothetical protein IJU86_01215, partial [Firmicutes bacterium]|nr:hypothetical protein [Bacillota bacterium]